MSINLLSNKGDTPAFSHFACSEIRVPYDVTTTSIRPLFRSNSERRGPLAFPYHSITFKVPGLLARSSSDFHWESSDIGAITRVADGPFDEPFEAFVTRKLESRRIFLDSFFGRWLGVTGGSGAEFV